MVVSKTLNDYLCLSLLAWGMWTTVTTSPESCCKDKINLTYVIKCYGNVTYNSKHSYCAIEQGPVGIGIIEE